MRGQRRQQIEAAARAWVDRTPSRWFQSSLVHVGDAMLTVTHLGKNVELRWTATATDVDVTTVLESREPL